MVVWNGVGIIRVNADERRPLLSLGDGMLKLMADCRNETRRMIHADQVQGLYITHEDNTTRRTDCTSCGELDYSREEAKCGGKNGGVREKEWLRGRDPFVHSLSSCIHPQRVGGMVTHMVFGSNKAGAKLIVVRHGRVESATQLIAQQKNPD